MGLLGARARVTTGRGEQTPTERAALESQRCILGLAAGRADQHAVERVDAMMPTLIPAAVKHGIDPRMLGAIAVKESHGLNIAERGKGKGMGVFQLTNQPGVTAAQAYNIPFAADYAAGMLAANRRTLAGRFPNFTSEQLTQATAAAYNKGAFRKDAYRITADPASIDAGTAPTGNYGRTILDLMNCFPGP